MKMYDPAIKSGQRNNQGMSLAAVLAFGVVITLFATALLGTMIPVLNRTVQFKSAGTARSYAELGLDYAISQLNAGQGSLNCASSAGSTINWTIPQSILNDPQASVRVDISALNTATGNPPAGSVLHDTLLDASNQYAYRMAIVTARYGQSTKQIRALLQPIASVVSGGNSQPNQPGGPPRLNGIPGFPYGMFGVAAVVYAGQAGYSTYNSPDPRFGADGGSLGKISQVFGGSNVAGNTFKNNNNKNVTATPGLTRSIIQGGSHYEFPDPQSYYAKQFDIVGNVYSATKAATAPWNTMTGNSYSNGNNTSYFPSGGPSETRSPGIPSSGSNSSDGYYWGPDSESPNEAARSVYGGQNGLVEGIPNGNKNGTVPVTGSWSGAVTTWNPGPKNANGVTYPQPEITPVQGAPAGTPSLGSVNITNGGQLIFDSSAPPITKSLGTIGSGKTVRIPPGAYNVSALSVTGGGKISIDPTTQQAIASGSESPVGLWVGAGANNSSIVLNVDNDSSINMDSGISNPNTANGFNTSGNIGIKSKNNYSVLRGDQLAISPPGDATNVVETKGGSGQMQIYYGGSSWNPNGGPNGDGGFNNQILLSGNQRMTIYAPNAGIMLGSSSVSSKSGPSALDNSTNFYGAIVGANVGVNSAYGSGGGVFMHYDWKLRPAGMGAAMDPWQPRPTIVYPTSSGTTVLDQYRAVTWQEAVTPSANNPTASENNGGPRWRY